MSTKPTGTETESALTTSQAVRHLSATHSIDFTEAYLDQLARDGKAPSHKVGRKRMYRPSLLDQFALGEWTPDAA